MPTVDELVSYSAAIEAARQARRKPTRTEKQRFYSSLGWRRVRYAALAANAAKHGGVPRCELCGRGPDAVVLHGDHKEPISTPEGWARRFDVAGVRIACAECNGGRLNSPIELEGVLPSSEIGALPKASRE
jgi:hypothetical protein